MYPHKKYKPVNYKSGMYIKYSILAMLACGLLLGGCGKKEEYESITVSLPKALYSAPEPTTFAEGEQYGTPTVSGGSNPGSWPLSLQEVVTNKMLKIFINYGNGTAIRHQLDKLAEEVKAFEDGSPELISGSGKPSSSGQHYIVRNLKSATKHWQIATTTGTSANTSDAPSASVSSTESDNFVFYIDVTQAKTAIGSLKGYFDNLSGVTKISGTFSGLDGTSSGSVNIEMSSGIAASPYQAHIAYSKSSTGYDITITIKINGTNAVSNIVLLSSGNTLGFITNQQQTNIKNLVPSSIGDLSVASRYVIDKNGNGGAYVGGTESNLLIKFGGGVPTTAITNSGVLKSLYSGNNLVYRHVAQGSACKADQDPASSASLVATTCPTILPNIGADQASITNEPTTASATNITFSTMPNVVVP